MGDVYLAVLEGISSLIDKSLLWREEQAEDEPRFMMLETVREYAIDCLVATGELEQIRSAHAEFFVTLAEDAEHHLKGPMQVVWLERLEQEHDNLRAALQWSKEGKNVEIGLRIAAAAWRFWDTRAYLNEGYGWLEEELARAESENALASVRAKCFYGAASLALNLCDYDQAVKLFEKALALYRELMDKDGIASSLCMLGELARSQRNYERAAAFHEESVAVRRELGDELGTAASLLNIGILATDRCNYERAATLIAESLALYRKEGYKSGIGNALNSLGEVAREQGNYERAVALYTESLALYREVGDKLGVAIALNNLGEAVKHQGDYERATELFAESITLCREMSFNGIIPIVLYNLGDVALHQGKYEQAVALYTESLALWQETNEKRTITLSMEGLAIIACMRGQVEQAAQLLGTAEAFRQSLGITLPSGQSKEYYQHLSDVKTALGEDAFRNALSQGRLMTIEQVMLKAH